MQVAASVSRIRRFLGLLAVAATIAAAPACGDSDSEAGPATTATTTEPQPPTAPTTTETDGIDPLEGAGRTPVESDAGSDETALLERVALGRHEGFDRIVFQFRNAVPGYRVEYVEPPLREDGSGNRVDVAGTAFVLVRMEPASGFDLTVPEGELVYTGPRRLRGSDAGTSVVQEAARTGDFEAVLSWAVGLSDPVDFRVRTLSSPPRLVVDFRNH